MKKLAIIMAVAAGVLFAPAAAKAEGLAFNPSVLVVTSKPLYTPANYKHGPQHHKKHYNNHHNHHHVKHVKPKPVFKKQCPPRYAPIYYHPRPHAQIWWYR